MKTLVLLAIIATVYVQGFAQVNVSGNTNQNDASLKIKNNEVALAQNPDSSVLFGVSKDTLDEKFVEKSDKQDTTRIVLGNKKIVIIKGSDGKDHVEIYGDDHEDDASFDDYDNNDDFESLDNHKHHHRNRFDGHWDGVEFGFNNYVDKNFSTSKLDTTLDLDPGRSIEFNLNLFEKCIPIYKNNIGLVTGLGFQFNNYVFDHNNLVLTDRDSVVFLPITDTLNTYTRNKLVTTYLTLPIILEFQVPVGNRPKNLFVAVGATGSVKLGSHTTMKQDDGDKTKNRQDFNLSQFRYGVTARLGYAGLNLYANYSLQPLFKKDRGPELYPFSIGLSFTGNF